MDIYNILYVYWDYLEVNMGKVGVNFCILVEFIFLGWNEDKF